MSTFEIEGHATKEFPCDIAVIQITFKDVGKSSSKLAKNVLDECDRFIEDVSGIGITPQDIHHDDDNIRSNSYRDDEKIVAARNISIRTPFDMKYINRIHDILCKGNYCYELSVSGDISNKSEIVIELAKEAVMNSKREAEQIAEVLGIKLIGIESIRNDKWDSEPDYIELCRCKSYHKEIEDNRVSDNIEARLLEQEVKLKVTWILE